MEYILDLLWTLFHHSNKWPPSWWLSKVGRCISFDVEWCSSLYWVWPLIINTLKCQYHHALASSQTNISPMLPHTTSWSGLKSDKHITNASSHHIRSGLQTHSCILMKHKIWPQPDKHIAHASPMKYNIWHHTRQIPHLCFFAKCFFANLASCQKKHLSYFLSQN